MTRLALLLVFVSACSEATQEDVADDHASDRLVIEDGQIPADPIRSTDGFRRLGLLWDAAQTGALEVRTSLDGVVWAEWRTPDIVWNEQEAYAGHVDAIAGIGPEGSIDSDPRAFFYQLRAASVTPTFIVAEPVVEIPALITEEIATPDVEDPEPIEAATPIGSVTIHSRSEWGARRPRCGSGSQTPTRATIHHTVTPTNDSLSVPARLRQIQSFHMFTRGWCDIGYNYLVSRDGRIWTGRGARTIGAHVANNNTGNVGVSFIGTYISTAPTETQMCNVARLLRRTHENFGGLALNRTDVKGHRQFGGTSCPGDALYARIDKILRKARGGCAVD